MRPEDDSLRGEWLNYEFDLMDNNDIFKIFKLSDFNPKKGIVDIKDVNTKKYFNVTKLKSYTTEDSIYTDGRIVEDVYGKAIVDFSIALIFKWDIYSNTLKKLDIIINSDSPEKYEYVRKHILTKYINPCTFKFLI